MLCFACCCSNGIVEWHVKVVFAVFVRCNLNLLHLKNQKKHGTAPSLRLPAFFPVEVEVP